VDQLAICALVTLIGIPLGLGLLAALGLLYALGYGASDWSWAGRSCGPRRPGRSRSWLAGRSCGWWPWCRSWVAGLVRGGGIWPGALVAIWRGRSAARATLTPA
jgi:hypothetical protein